MKKQISTLAVQRILKRNDLDLSDKIVYIYLYTLGIQINSHGNLNVGASIAEIASFVNISERTASKSIKHLIEKNLIKPLITEEPSNTKRHYFLNNGKEVDRPVEKYSDDIVKCMDNINHARSGNVYHINIEWEYIDTISHKMRAAYRQNQYSVLIPTTLGIEYYLTQSRNANANYSNMIDADVVIFDYTLVRYDKKTLNAISTIISKRIRHKRLTLILNSDSTDELQSVLEIRTLVSIPEKAFLDLVSIRQVNDIMSNLDYVDI